MASRDVPHTFHDLAFGWTHHLHNEITLNKSQAALDEQDVQPEGLEAPKEVKVKNLWPAFTSGAGLFSDGYINNSISTVGFCLKSIYGKAYAQSNAISNVSSIAFAGTVVGMLSFGYISDRIARKGGMMAANVMLILFAILCAVGTWGVNGDPHGLFTSLTVFRFFLGIAIGAEYPTSSVIASEFANQLPAGKRNRYFVWFTNGMIDFGFVISAFVPMVLLWIFSSRRLGVVWRLTLGLGAIPPLSLFFLRLKLTNSESFKKLSMAHVQKFPIWLVIKFYWFRLGIVSLLWFIYNFSSYAFSIYSTTIIGSIIPDADIYKTFGWSVVFNLFYIPGSFLGAISADYIGPRLTFALGVGLQGIIGFIMSGLYGHLKKHIAGFVVVYGIFSTLGEFGPGDNIGLLASKSSATPIRGQYYGIAAAFGKIGAFVGTYVFPIIIKNGSRGGTDPDRGAVMPFFISSGLCLFSAMLALFFLPAVGQDAINKEDIEFVDYLRENGFDVSQLGTQSEKSEIDEISDMDHSLAAKEDTHKVKQVSVHSGSISA